MTDSEKLDSTIKTSNENHPSVRPELAAQGEPTAAAAAQESTTTVTLGKAGPLSLEKIRQLRLSQQAAAESRRPKSNPKSGGGGKPSPQSDPESSESNSQESSNRYETGKVVTPPPVAPKVAVPSRRGPLSEDLENELNEVMGGQLDLDQFMSSDVQVGTQLAEGHRLYATVIKVHGENVFVSLGGANEGVVSILQFSNAPEPGAQVEVVVRGFLSDEGLYEVLIPGSTVVAADWSDIKEGEVVEALITVANTGGLECQIGNIRGFIPASQVAPYRVENFAEYVGQRVLCVITEANQRRGNLVLSRRAVLERERQQERESKLAALEVGAMVKGIVRKITDFGAFVDIGGLDGLLHIRQLSWERVQHPSEVLQPIQEIQVRVDKIDPQTGKIGLSLRSLQEHPWANILSRFTPGSIVKGTVTRLAEFGAFVKLATGVEGLVHISELAHHRVSNVSSVVSEGQEVDVKVLSIEGEKQRISLSLKAAQAVTATQDDQEQVQEETEQPTIARLPAKRAVPLRGGTGGASGGQQFGLKW
ncbi:MAG TPA: hypothetical protein DCF63_08410 [Planctomycetaceae bacterium]|nr:hypothetical protein [Planctomycetaceae bacterium]